METELFTSIVFVENSGYPFPLKEMEKTAKAHNAEFELLQIKTDIRKTVEFGKSYGEADCIEQGITLSRLAKDEEYFVKCTGRVFVKNIKKLCGRKQNVNKFLFRDDMNRCYTVIFQMNIEEYRKYFFRAKDICNEKEGIDIEKAFYKIIFESGIKFCSCVS